MKPELCNFKADMWRKLYTSICCRHMAGNQKILASFFGINVESCRLCITPFLQEEYLSYKVPPLAYNKTHGGCLSWRRYLMSGSYFKGVGFSQVAS